MAVYGQTVPKIETNPSYPQRVPDPIVDIKMFGVDGKEIF